MNELSIFQKEEELLKFGTRFLEKYGPASEDPSLCPHGNLETCGNQEIFYNAFKRVFRSYKKLFQQTTRLIRLSDRQQLKLDTANHSLKESQKKLEVRNEFIRSIFSRYMSDEVVESILETPEGLRMGGEKKEVTVMMSDLRGFTAISETLPAETVVTIVNLYLEIMTEIVFKYQGTINNFLGDGIMILFGAPIAREDDAKRAVACALEMQRAMSEVNTNNKKLGYPKLNMGIGIHTGMVVAGNIGSNRRSHYTVMGRVVNLAARIESYTVGGQVLISENTQKACHALLRIDDSMDVTPKGIEQTITLNQVSGIGGKYDVHLDDPKKVVYHKLAEVLPIHFAVLTGKHTGTLDCLGEIYRLSMCGAKIRTDVSVAPFTNVNIALDYRGREIAQGLAGKVVRGTSEEVRSIEVVFTFVPVAAQKFFKEILASDNSTPKQSVTPEALAAQPVVKPLLKPSPADKGQESRGSLRRRGPEPIALPIKMEDGSTLQTVIGDFSLDGMFLNTGEQKPPRAGMKGSFEVMLHDYMHGFVFEVAHAYQNGIGVKITQDHDVYSLALLDGVFGAFFPTESSP